jgi:phage baseplate assembly protein W
MAERFINITFPFKDDDYKNYFLKMNSDGNNAIKSDLIHLLLTTPGDRLYLPEFGTNLRQYIFEPNDTKVREDIQAEVQNSVSKFIPNLKITSLTVERPSDTDYYSNPEHTAVVRIDYVVTEGALNKVDFVTITV